MRQERIIDLENQVRDDALWVIIGTPQIAGPKQMFPVFFWGTFFFWFGTLYFMERMYIALLWNRGEKRWGFPLFFNSWTGRGMNSYPLGLVRMIKSTKILSRSTWKPWEVASATPRKINMLKQDNKKVLKSYNLFVYYRKNNRTNLAAALCYFTDMKKIWTKEMSWKHIWILVPIFSATQKTRCWTWAFQATPWARQNDGGKKWLWDDNRWQVPWEQSLDPRDGSIYLMTPGTCCKISWNGNVENGRYMINSWYFFLAWVGWWFENSNEVPLSKDSSS